MPASGEAPDLLVDTSVAIALTLADHEHHESALGELAGLELGLAGHAAFETLSVLTRLPGSGRLSPAAALRAIELNFPRTLHLSAEGARDLLGSLAEHGVAGGSVYDALVGAVANEHGLTLCSRDRRARSTYRTLDVDLMQLP